MFFCIPRLRTLSIFYGTFQSIPLAFVVLFCYFFSSTPFPNSFIPFRNYIQTYMTLENCVPSNPAESDGNHSEIESREKLQSLSFVFLKEDTCCSCMSMQIQTQKYNHQHDTGRVCVPVHDYKSTRPKIGLLVLGRFYYGPLL